MSTCFVAPPFRQPRPCCARRLGHGIGDRPVSRFGSLGGPQARRLTLIGLTTGGSGAGPGAEGPLGPTRGADDVGDGWVGGWASVPANAGRATGGSGAASASGRPSAGVGGARGAGGGAERQGQHGVGRGRVSRTKAESLREAGGVRRCRAAQLTDHSRSGRREAAWAPGGHGETVPPGSPGPPMPGRHQERGLP